MSKKERVKMTSAEYQRRWRLRNPDKVAAQYRRSARTNELPPEESRRLRLAFESGGWRKVTKGVK